MLCFVIGGILCFSLIVIAVHDYRFRSYHAAWLVPVGFASYVLGSSDNLKLNCILLGLTLSVTMMVHSIISRIVKQEPRVVWDSVIGEGDILLLVALTPLLSADQYVGMIAVASVLGILFGRCYKGKTIPFASMLVIVYPLIWAVELKFI